MEGGSSTGLKKAGVSPRYYERLRMKNGVWTKVRFSIWNPDTLVAAGKPLERVREGEVGGVAGAYDKLIEKAELVYQIRQEVYEDPNAVHRAIKSMGRALNEVRGLK